MVRRRNVHMRSDEFAAHKQTYRGFVGMLGWFAAHMALILAGLYFIAIAHQASFGIFLVLVAAAVLVFGVGKRLRGSREARELAGPVERIAAPR